MVPLEPNYSFRELREIILAAMGWQDTHLSEFNLTSEGIHISDDSADDEWLESNMEEHLRERDTLINAYLYEGQKFEFVYDFGDDWQHQIVVEKVVDDYENEFPRVIKYKGNCPPEDVGGLWGYADFLEVMGNAEDPEHEDVKEWAKDQDYGDYNPVVSNGLMCTIKVDQKERERRKQKMEKELSERNNQTKILDFESMVRQRKQKESQDKRLKATTHQDIENGGAKAAGNKVKVLTEEDVYQHVVNSATQAVELLLRYSVKRTDAKSILNDLAVRELQLVADTYELTDITNLNKEALVNRIYAEILKGDGLVTVLDYLSNYQTKFLIEFSIIMHSEAEVRISSQFPKEVILLLASYCLVSFFYKGGKIYGFATKEAKEMFSRMQSQ
jgi:hypothetical protein